MDKRTLLVLSTAYILQADGAFYTTTLSSSLKPDDSKCKIATPPIYFNPDGIHVAIGEFNESHLVENGVWVGYYRMQNAFDYIGCKPSSMKTLDEAEIQNVTLASPGICYSACAYISSFGIFQNQCYCLKPNWNTPETNQASCNLECDGQIGPVCGGLSGNESYVISVYKHNPYVKAGNDFEEENAFCLELNSSSNEHHWSNCSKHLENMCKFGESYLPIASVKIVMSWGNNSDACIQNGGLAIPFQHGMVNGRSLENYEQLWTKVIRSPAILPLKTNEKFVRNAFRHNHGIDFGYIIKRHDKIVLEFSKSTDDRRYILCTQDAERESKDAENLTISILTVVLLAALLSIIVIKRRRVRLWLMSSPYFKRRYVKNQSNKKHEDSPTGTGVDREASASQDINTNILTDQYISVQVHVSVDTNADRFENNDYDTANRNISSSYVENHDVYSRSETGNKSSYDNTLSRNRKLICMSDQTYDRMKKISYQIYGSIETLKSADISNGISKSVQDNNAYCSVEFKEHALTDFQENVLIDDEYVSLQIAKTSFKNSNENTNNVDTLEFDISIDGNIKTEDSYDEVEFRSSESTANVEKLLETDNAENNKSYIDYELSAVKDDFENIKSSFTGSNNKLPVKDTLNFKSLHDGNLDESEFNESKRDLHDEGEYVAIESEIPAIIHQCKNGNCEEFEKCTDGNLLNDFTYDDVDLRFFKLQEFCKPLTNNGECNAGEFETHALVIHENKHENVIEFELSGVGYLQNDEEQENDSVIKDIGNTEKDDDDSINEDESGKEEDTESVNENLGGRKEEDYDCVNENLGGRKEEAYDCVNENLGGRKEEAYDCVNENLGGRKEEAYDCVNENLGGRKEEAYDCVNENLGGRKEEAYDCVSEDLDSRKEVHNDCVNEDLGCKEEEDDHGINKNFAGRKEEDESDDEDDEGRKI